MALQRVDAPLSTWEEAHRVLKNWEASGAGAEHIILVRSGGTDYEVDMAGPDMKPTSVSGLLFAAAQLVLE